jgi:succinoglycan biosynthesis transport protein ExoP
MVVTPEPAALDLRQLSRVLLRRRWLLLLPWVAAVLVGVAAAFLLKPIYVSQVTLVLEQPQALTGPLGGMVGGGVSGDQQAEMMREHVHSTPFLRSVISATGLKTDPATRAWALAGSHRYPGLPADQQVEAFLIEYLRGAIDVRRERGDVFQIAVGAFEAERARRLAESVARQFVMASKAAQLEATRGTQLFSIEQQEVYRRKLVDSEMRLEAAARAALGSGVPQLDATNVARARGLLEQAGLELEEQRQKLAGLRTQLQGRGLEPNLELLSSPRSATLAAQLAELDRQLSAVLLAESGGDGGAGVRLLISRKYAELEEELDRGALVALPSLPTDARDLLVRTRLAQADLGAKQAGHDEIGRQVSSYQREQSLSPDRDLAVQRLRQEVESNRTLYNSFVQQAAASQISEAFQNARVGGRFSVLEPATLPLAPARPNRPLIVLLAFVLGGIVGVGTVLVVEQHDESMKDAQEVESLLGLPVLGAVPRVGELGRSSRRGASVPATDPPLLHTGTAGPRDGLIHRLKVESPLGLEFRRIYLKLAKTHGRALPRTLMVTSATRGEGKTTITACLAITLARELREKVLLVDFDLRSPSLHRALGLPSATWGLAQMLQSRVLDERHVRATSLPHLDFLAAGRPERPAGELVDTAACEWFFREVMPRYSLVLVDAPPNLAVPDPLILGRAVEGVLYVIKAGSTIRKAAEYGVKVQREARDNVLGILMNDAGEVLPSYYGYRAGSYGYTPEEAGGA